MKTTNFFKMNLDNGEGEFKPSADFRWEEPLLKLDIMKDWIEDLQIEYNATIKHWEKQMKKIAKNES